MTTLTKKDEAESVGPSGAPAAQTPAPSQEACRLLDEMMEYFDEYGWRPLPFSQAWLLRKLAIAESAAEQRRDVRWKAAVNAPHVRFHREEACDWCAPLVALLASNASASEGGPHGK